PGDSRWLPASGVTATSVHQRAYVERSVNVAKQRTRGAPIVRSSRQRYSVACNCLLRPARPPGEVDVTRPVAVVLPRDVADPLGPVAGDGEARPRLLARSVPPVIHALGRGEGRAAVEARRGEDVGVSEAGVPAGPARAFAVERGGRGGAGARPSPW